MSFMERTNTAIKCRSRLTEAMDSVLTFAGTAKAYGATETMDVCIRT